MQGLLEATLTLVNEHDIKAEDVTHVRVRTSSNVYEGQANSATRRYPKNRYTADHSCFYTTAVAILDRAVGPEQFSQAKLEDPKVRALVDKISVEPDSELEEFDSPGIVEIVTKTGGNYSYRVVHPKGHPMNPMTDAEIEQKFRGIAGKFMSGQQMKEIIDSVANLEKLKDIQKLIALLIFPDDPLLFKNSSQN
jgi:2-methylcitrate dehydratase